MDKLTHVLQRLLLAFANRFSSILPPTRGFGLRATVFRWAGLQVAQGVQIVGGAQFHYSNISIGDNTWIGNGCHFYTSATASIHIGKNIDFAPHCLVNTGSHRLGLSGRRAGTNYASSIVIGDGTWVGMGCIILDGTTIGYGCVLAAGAVVRGTFPDNVLIGGVPAKVIKTLA
jgi:maltose O-acetyltransferase